MHHLAADWAATNVTKIHANWFRSSHYLRQYKWNNKVCTCTVTKWRLRYFAIIGFDFQWQKWECGTSIGRKSRCKLSNKLKLHYNPLHQRKPLNVEEFNAHCNVVWCAMCAVCVCVTFLYPLYVPLVFLLLFAVSYPFVIVITSNCIKNKSKNIMTTTTLTQ